ncbi:MAG: formate/nitrite transporter family protein [Nitrospiraceae bacterium]|nr:formate/nitrite transporter family protein [Nitrospiraceae bacterium]
MRPRYKQEPTNCVGLHGHDITRIAQQVQTKAAFLDGMPMGYVISSVLAGVYLGFGIVLIFSVGAPFAAAGDAAQKVVMGGTFGLALMLVIFAGAELFTGNNMTCAVGALSRAISWRMVGRMWILSLTGNLIGSLVLAWLVVQSGVLSHAPQSDVLMKAAALKMNLSGWELFVRGILCNWLVCLAVWMAGRLSSETARLIAISWCLLAFVGSGYEHSIANQSLLSMALFLPHPDTVTWTGFLYNQLWVLPGNVIGGSLCVGVLYWLAGAPLALRHAESPVPTGSALSIRSVQT